MLRHRPTRCSPKRPLSRVSVVGLLSLGLLAQLAPSAEAYNPSERGTQRPRHGDSNWMPAYVAVSSDYAITGTAPNQLRTNTFTIKFKYEQSSERYENDGSEQVLEIDLKIPCEGGAGSGTVNQWAKYNDSVTTVQHMDYRTDGGGWTTNIPNIAHPYERRPRPSSGPGR